MSFKLQTKYVIIAIIGVFLALFIVGYIIGHNSAKDALNGRIQTLESEIQRYVVRIGDDSVYIAQKEQEIKTVKQAKKNGDIRNEELRKLNLKQVNEISRLKLRVDTLLKHVEHNGSIIVVHDTINRVDSTRNALLLPFSFNKTDNYLSLNGNFDSQGKLDISIKMDVPVDLWAGIEKKTKKPIAILTSRNPYINVLSISSIKMDTYKPKPYGIGVFAGYGVNLTGTIKASPVIGIGVSYNVIRF